MAFLILPKIYIIKVETKWKLRKTSHFLVFKQLSTGYYGNNYYN